MQDLVVATQFQYCFQHRFQHQFCHGLQDRFQHCFDIGFDFGLDIDFHISLKYFFHNFVVQDLLYTIVNYKTIDHVRNINAFPFELFP